MRPRKARYNFVSKSCLTCNTNLVLTGNRDIDNKRYCSRKCHIEHLRKTTDKEFVCELCDTRHKSIANQRWCRECVPREGPWYHRATHYGIGKKQWANMLSNQNGTCALCDKPPDVVDHNHETGAVRGLLCLSCNAKMSGNDNALWIAKVLDYSLGRGKMIIEEFQISIQCQTREGVVAWNSGTVVPNNPDLTFDELVSHLKAISTDKFLKMKATAPNTNPHLSV